MPKYTDKEIGNHFKLKKADVKKAIKTVGEPTWSGLSRMLKCHRITIQRFLQLDNNKELLEQLQERRGNIDTIAVDLIEDEIIAGDTKLALRWLEYKDKVQNGTKINLQGSMDLKIIIEDISKNNDNEDE